MNILTPDQLKPETLLPCLNTRFRVGLDAAGFIELELVEVNVMNSPGQANPAAARPVQESFSLVFHGPDNRFLPQRIYPFEHNQIGRFELFIVPIGKKPGSIEYQAVFNRLVKPA